MTQLQQIEAFATAMAAFVTLGRWLGMREEDE